ncbi:DUF2937 family protein (plasmid) [Photobacterium sp. GJ3]|uniref:DUF2937 family protein n=1 Tax=Photobacterium sp. GJ3 TaxID=2829502 RepID=UPI001B8C2827|nr:DUF2937 family protein [Photobacterium sp. GJ3]QUJ69546.1 DUF2937 family protein [Photobacterium sp. GJ3]
MIGRLLDKLIFGAALLAALQLPLLAEHYQQYLSGLYDATKWQVDGYEATAHQFGYASTQAMIERHLTNDEPSVQADARQKQATVIRYQALQHGLAVFRQGDLMAKTLYMFHPSRIEQLETTLENFKPGIPLTVHGILFGVIAALAVNLLLTFPFLLIARWSRKKQMKAAHAGRYKIS